MYATLKQLSIIVSIMIALATFTGCGGASADLPELQPHNVPENPSDFVDEEEHIPSTPFDSIESNSIGLDITYELVRTNEDGSKVVEVPVLKYREETRTSLATLSSGEEIEQEYTVTVPYSEVHTLTIPADEDIQGYLKERYEAVPDDDTPAPLSDMVPEAPLEDVFE